MARDTRGHGEFSGGPGMFGDGEPSERRSARVIGNDSGTAVMYNLGEELKEIYATDPMVAGQDLSSVVVPPRDGSTGR